MTYNDDPPIGLCATGAYDAECWFSEDVYDTREAIRVCRQCPIQSSCLEGALERRERRGVWGGRLMGRRTTPLRQWAADQGIVLNRNGRIPDDVQDAYYASLADGTEEAS